MWINAVLLRILIDEAQYLMQWKSIRLAARCGMNVCIPVKDRDYVVVGATPEQMMARGYRPVGRDFPVFLHPQTQEEYALARTERKTARGYRGFQFYCAPDVTLEQDLARRDLTINAMARAVDANGAPAGPVIDPFNGRA